MNTPSDPPARERAYGFSEWFPPGECERAEQALEAMEQAGARLIRTRLSWAGFHAEGGEAWYDWLLPRLGARFDLLLCLDRAPHSPATDTATDPSLPRGDYAGFVDAMLTRYCEHLEAVEFPDAPDSVVDASGRAGQSGPLSWEWIASAARRARQHGVKTVFGAPYPVDPDWLRRVGERGILAEMDAVGLHGYLTTGEREIGTGRDWNQLVSATRDTLNGFNPDAEIWITEAGCSTWRHQETKQAESFLQALAAPAGRLYWCGWQDIADNVALQDGLRLDERHYHLGLVDQNGQQKLLGRLLMEGGLTTARGTMALAAPRLAIRAAPIVIAGGAGFIGSNLADSFLREGRDVLLLDNLSRPGVERNLRWLKQAHGERVHWHSTDMRDEALVRDILRDAGAVFHLAAQVAVTTSLEQPVQDFEINARGTLNLLEAVRRSGRRTPVIFASTNKVYGNLSDLTMMEHDDRYVPADNDIAANGIGEARNLDFCTPYGCSKGVADQYVLDYAKSYNLPTAVLRMSCIYGPRQFGTEDQGWVAHFLIKALRGEALTIYGDGKQVRDILHVTDAVAAYRAILARVDEVKGRAFNLGGGPDNAVSLRVVLAEIARLLDGELSLRHGEVRQGDQTYFVADTRRLEKAVGWRPRIGWRDGLRDLHDWLRSSEGPASSASAALPSTGLALEGRKVPA